MTAASTQEALMPVRAQAPARARFWMPERSAARRCVTEPVGVVSQHSVGATFARSARGADQVRIEPRRAGHHAERGDGVRPGIELRLGERSARAVARASVSCRERGTA